MPQHPRAHLGGAHRQRARAQLHVNVGVCTGAAHALQAREGGVGQHAAGAPARLPSVPAPANKALGRAKGTTAAAPPHRRRRRSHHPGRPPRSAPCTHMAGGGGGGAAKLVQGREPPGGRGIRHPRLPPHPNRRRGQPKQLGNPCATHLACAMTAGRGTYRKTANSLKRSRATARSILGQAGWGSRGGTQSQRT